MTIHQTRVGRPARGKEGSLYGDPAHYREVSYGVTAGRASQAIEVQVTSASDGTDYSFEMFGETVTITSGTSATVATIAQALAEAANANPVLAGLAEIDDDGTDTVEIDASYPGIDLQVSTADASLTVTEAAAPNKGATIPFGRAVVRDGAGCKLFTGAVQSYTLTLSYNSGDEAGITVLVDGVGYSASVTQATSGASSATALASALNSATPATITASSSGAVITVTGAAGTNFAISSVVGDFAVAQTGEATEVLGITRATYNEASTVIGDASAQGYGPGRDAIVLERGLIFVAGGDAAGPSSPVYIGTSTEAGQFFDAPGSGRVNAGPNLKWHSPNVIEIARGV